MNSEYIAQAIVTLEGESKYHSDDLKDLTQVYAKFDNWLSDEAENGDDLERAELLDTILWLIKDKIVRVAMKENHYFLNEELAAPQWEKID